MKNFFYVLMVLFLSANFTSCTPEALNDKVQETATTGEDGEIEEEEEDDDGTGNGISGN